MILFAKLNAQVLDSKWLKVVELADQSVFLDSTNIKQVNNQITIVSLTQFNHPQYITAYKKEAGSIKSQVLLNISTRKYILLGSLYYDNQLRIIGETSLPGFSLGNEAFAISVDSNKTIKALYQKSISLLGIDTSKYVAQESTSKEERLRSLIDNSGNVISNPQTEINQNVDAAEKDKVNKNQSADKNLTAKKNNDSNYGYDLSSEKNVRSMIFSDGQKYCFQVSSWRQKVQAEREIERLKRNGEQAFLVEANVPSKGGKWYRVRIGYFNSLEEIENYLRKR